MATGGECEVGERQAFSGNISPVKAQGIEREWEMRLECVGPDGTGLNAYAKEPQLYIVAREFYMHSYSELTEEGNR